MLKMLCIPDLLIEEITILKKCFQRQKVDIMILSGVSVVFHLSIPQQNWIVFG